MPVRIDVITIFPRMLEAPLAEGIVARARDASLVELHATDPRAFTEDRHRSVDDAPFGGGPGMVMKAEPLYRAVQSVLSGVPGDRDAVVLLSPRGKRFDQRAAERFARLDRLVLICGRYEGVDERVAEAVATEELSVGDFVLTGGETAALCVIEATVRLLPGALGDAESAAADSFGGGLLDFPHYTRPAEWRGRAVPGVLLSGDHGRVARWRRQQALVTTRERRPDLLRSASLSRADEALLREHDETRSEPDVEVQEKVGMKP
jgi:tRNA (guanine37-N1)-methyltransferase